MKRISNSIILVFAFILVAFGFSCREASCQEAAEVNRPDELNLIIESSSGSAYKLRLEGTNPITNKKGKFIRQNYTWSQPFIKDIAVGDTVVKFKGELKFYIHKSDTILVFPFKCRGEEFN